jgi:hypothetical protein
VVCKDKVMLLGWHDVKIYGALRCLRTNIGMWVMRCCVVSVRWLCLVLSMVVLFGCNAVIALFQLLVVYQGFVQHGMVAVA